MDINLHTSSPVIVDQEILLYAPEGRGVVATAHHHNKTPTEYVANARLLAAAYTVFDGAGRKLGVDAAEMAERLGPEGLAEVREALGTVIGLIVKHGLSVKLAEIAEAGDATDHQRLEAARAALAKLTGE